jgi:hypothetical protein
MLPLFMSMYWGSMLPLFMSMCMRWGSGGNCCLCSFPCVCVREVGVNVASVHLHMYVLREGQCCPCSCPCVRTINVASGHVHVYVFGGRNVAAVHVASVHVNVHVLGVDQCCLCS